MAEERVPETIGRYQIRGELGRGMMGVVYEAYDPSLHRSVALKVVRLLFAITDSDREGFERRFLSEAQIAARLSHSGIVVVHDVGRDPQTGILYIALERLQGRTLADMTAAGERLPWRRALQITAQVAQALAYAHREGVVHRDIKPANVMVLPTGEAKIMDFGLAKHEAGHELTQAGQFVGTPLFMAPEQVLGQKVDGRTDLFSLGSVLYTLLTGARAFAADSVPRVMSRVAHQEPRPATELSPDLPPVLDDVLARALAKSPADRYPSCEDLAEDLEDVLAGRSPRHLADWTRPPEAEATMVSTGGLRRAAAPPPAPRRRTRPLRTFTLLVLLAGFSTLYFRSGLPERFAEAVGPLLAPHLPPGWPPAWLTLPGRWAPPAPAGRRPAASRERSRVEGEPAREARRSPSPVETMGAASPSPAPGAAPQAEAKPAPPPSPRPAAPRAAKPAPAPPAALSVRMEHHLKSGTVRIWLGGRLVVEEELDAQVEKKLMFIPMRKGVVEEQLTVPPGRHVLRVQVKWDDNVETKRIPGTFRSGATRQLEVRVSRLRGSLSLEWK